MCSRSLYAVRMTLKDAKKDYEKTEDDLKSLQSVGQIIGEVLRQLDEDRCEWQGAGHRLGLRVG